MAKNFAPGFQVVSNGLMCKHACRGQCKDRITSQFLQLPKLMSNTFSAFLHMTCVFLATCPKSVEWLIYVTFIARGSTSGPSHPSLPAYYHRA